MDTRTYWDILPHRITRFLLYLLGTKSQFRFKIVDFLGEEGALDEGDNVDIITSDYL